MDELALKGQGDEGVKNYHCVRNDQVIVDCNV